MSGAMEVAVLLWRAMEARDWSAVAGLLAPELRVEWPQSGELFDREGYLKVNRDYPGDWHLRVLRVVGEDEQVVTDHNGDPKDQGRRPGLASGPEVAGHRGARGLLGAIKEPANICSRPRRSA